MGDGAATAEQADGSATGRRSLAAAIGWAFQHERARRGLSQAAVAERLGTTQQWVSRVERGRITLSTRAIERLFGEFDLQVGVDVEPAGADLDGEIDEHAALGEAGRLAVVDGFRRPLARLAGVPWVLSGRFGAFLQGVPLRAIRLDLAVAVADLDALGEVFERELCDRWNERLMDYYGAPVDPREPGAMRWLLGFCEVRLEVGERAPPSVTVAVGGLSLPVRPLVDIETTHPDVARLARRARVRARLSTGSDGPVTPGCPIGLGSAPP